MGANQKIATTLGLLLAAVMLGSGSLFIGYIYGQNHGYQSGYETGQQITIQGQKGTKWEQESYQAGYQEGRQSQIKAASSVYELHNPSYQEMMEFLAQDPTNTKPYIADQYTCVDFAADVDNNAKAKGIRCAMVYILNKESIGHTIVAFETTDKGLQLVEPQYDKVVKLVVGQSYSALNKFAPQPNDDTIQRYLVIW